MSKIKIEIKSWLSGSILFAYETENNTIKKTLERAVGERIVLRGADLRDAVLRGADLRDADLRGAVLRDADLRDADLRDADLSGADLSGADLTPIKKDLFDVLLRAIPEISYLKKSIIEGRIDGSTYEGECACLNGTLYNSASTHNGISEMTKKRLVDCRNSSRPIERFFLGIKKGDTPETNPLSKLALEWIEEFESFINPILQPA